MASTVSIGLKTTGLSEVQNALKGVRKSLLELEKDSLSAVKEGSKARLAVLKSEYDQREAMAKRAAQVEANIRRSQGGGIGARPGRIGGGSGFGGGGGFSFGKIGEFAAGEMGVGQIARMGAAAGAAGAAVAAAFMILKGAIDIATTGLKMFGNFLLNDIIKPEMSLETKYHQLSAKSAEVGGRGLSAKDAKQAADLAFVKYNLPKEDAVAAMGAYGAAGGEGSWQDAPKILKLAAQEALVRGGKAETYAKVIAGLRVKGESVDETIAKYMAVRRQGDIIDVPVEELQNRGKQIKAAALFMGGSTAEKFAAANVLTQKASVWTADPASAITGLNRFTADVMINSKGVAHRKYEKFLGRDENGREVIQDVAGLLGQVIADTHGTPGKLPGLGFKDVRSQRFISSFTPEFDIFRKQAQGEGLTDKKKIDQRAAELFAESLRKMMKETDTLADIEKEAADRMKDSQQTIKNAFNQVQEVLSDQFMPVVRGIVQDLSPMFDELADYLEANTDEIGEALESLAKIFVIGAKAMEYELIGMVEVLKFVVNKFKYIIPGLAPLDQELQGATGKGMLDSVYNYVTDKNDDGTSSSGVIPRRFRKKGEVKVGEITFGPLKEDPNEPIKNKIGIESAAPKANLDPLNKQAEDTAAALGKLNKSIQDTANSLDKLNRSDSMLDKGGAPGRRY